MSNNVLIVTNNDVLMKAKEAGITAFLFPFKGYSVAFEKDYSLDEITEDNSYLYINRILTNEDIDNLKAIIKSLPANIKGIFFQDLGLIPVLKDYNGEKILFSHHLTTNYKSINYYLEYLTSVVISTDITKEEMVEILDKSSKNLCIYKFGMIPIMYSRRNLLTNYDKFYGKDINLKENIIEPMSQKKFKIIENEFGTVILPKWFYYNELVHEKIKYNIINPSDLNSDNYDSLFKNMIDGKFSFSTYDGFLNIKTIYKLPPKEVK